MKKLNGKYKTRAPGFRSQINMEVSFKDDVIKEIEIGKHRETKRIGRTALEQLPNKIIKSQSIAVDAISGATETSSGILGGVEKAIIEAGGNLEAYQTIVEKSVEKEYVSKETDFIIVGGGVAGLMAAITAANKGYKATIIERLPYIGGNAIISAGVIQGAGTSVQREYNILDDTPASFMKDLTDHDSKYKDKDKGLSKIMHENVVDMIEQLKTYGLRFVDFEKETPRYHIIYPRMFDGGLELVEILETEAKKLGVEIMLNTRGRKFIYDKESNRVVGVEAEGPEEVYEFKAKSVVVTSGGFSSNPEIISKYLPEYKDINSRASKGCQGDAIAMVEDVDGYTTAMDSGQHMFHVNPESGIDVPLLLLYTNAIIVNKSGKRYIDESGNYSDVAKALVNEEDSTAYIIFDEKTRQAYEPIEEYIVDEIVVQYDSLEALGNKLNLPELKNTVAAYNDMVDQGVDKDFGRVSNFDKLMTAPYYAIKVEPQIYNSYGGIKIDEQARVVSKTGEPIAGLYAAGEVTGSVEVQEGLLYTTGIGQGLVYGKLAVETAIKEL